ncbi:leucyl/phenylalanyl-tRNA--protein transferase [Altererythrobacter sp. TH136]|uniref:leucyl/phenylalanyl-tRNA--protein transferase n=1 Tax=Altererythrobacter sp. TH136 TaxID=2067415 RepID=UPI001165A894|nr:leucyl/phenylalanyl-tRNA--protein transferase [Altererythrobacter sp. TH136]QDM41340.1 leucyl/phenylalanyl-tRNA--protein transferase [Altererythrobacter sp. TH136]
MHAPASPPVIPSDLLLLAYRNGIFPMSDGRDDPEVFWVEPKMRAILPLDGLHVSRSLAKKIRKDHFQVTCNAAFDRVIEECARPRIDHPDSWISARIMASYRALHDEGHAHSIECWRAGDEAPELVGGLYGVQFGGVFCGESMFSRADDASKVALAWLVGLLKRGGSVLLDCQFMTEHLGSLGAVEIPQPRYVALLEDAAGVGAASLPAAFGALDEAAAGRGSSPGKLILQSLTQTS